MVHMMLFTKNVQNQSVVIHWNHYKPIHWIQVLDEPLKINHSDQFCELNE